MKPRMYVLRDTIMIHWLDFEWLIPRRWFENGDLTWLKPRRWIRRE